MARIFRKKNYPMILRAGLTYSLLRSRIGYRPGLPNHRRQIKLVPGVRRPVRRARPQHPKNTILSY